MNIDEANNIAMHYLKHERKLPIFTHVKIFYSELSAEGNVWLVKMEYTVNKKKHTADIQIMDINKEIVSFKGS